MTEEVQKEEIKEQVAPEVREYTEVEKRAMEMGWRPIEEFNGDEIDFVDAKEFVGRKPLYDKIARTSSELKNVKDALNALKVHYTKVQETEYKRALEKLKTSRTEAISNGDGAAFEQIDTEIKHVEQQMDEVKQAQNIEIAEPQISPEFTAWQSRNGWYSKTGYMRAWADEYGIKLHQEGLTPTQILKRVESDVRKEFPDKFVNPNKSSAPVVESSKGGTDKRGKDSLQLTAEERQVMRSLVRTNTMSEKEYMDSIRAMREAERNS